MPLNVVPILAAPVLPLHVLGVTVGLTPETALKLLHTAGLAPGGVALRAAARALIRRRLGAEVADPRRFWARQS